jgi:Flp pilus assembly protein TadG
MKNITQPSSNHGGKQQRRVTLFWSSSNLRNTVGQSLVELALTFPFFILLLAGSAEIGRLAYAAIEFSNAARAGVAYGAQNAATAADTTAIQSAATQDGSNLTALIATPTQFCACSNAPSTQVSCATAPTTCSPAPIHSLQYVQVQTSATINTLFHYPGIPATLTLHGRATMRVQ